MAKDVFSRALLQAVNQANRLTSPPNPPVVAAPPPVVPSSPVQPLPPSSVYQSFAPTFRPTVPPPQTFSPPAPPPLKLIQPIPLGGAESDQLSPEYTAYFQTRSNDPTYRAAVDANYQATQNPVFDQVRQLEQDLNTLTHFQGEQWSIRTSPNAGKTVEQLQQELNTLRSSEAYTSAEKTRQTAQDALGQVLRDYETKNPPPKDPKATIDNELSPQSLRPTGDTSQAAKSEPHPSNADKAKTEAKQNELAKQKTTSPK
jgi:hypothetical protein